MADPRNKNHNAVPAGRPGENKIITPSRPGPAAKKIITPCRAGPAAKKIITPSLGPAGCPGQLGRPGHAPGFQLRSSEHSPLSRLKTPPLARTQCRFNNRIPNFEVSTPPTNSHRFWRRAYLSPTFLTFIPGAVSICMLLATPFPPLTPEPELM